MLVVLLLSGLPIRAHGLQRTPAPVADAHDQALRGVVRTEPGREPVVGAFVALIDSSGERVRGALSDTSGAYGFAAVPSGTYHLEVERLGYSAFRSAPIELREGEAATHDVTLSLRPIELSAIPVSGMNRCDLSRDDAQRVTGLWNAARAGLNVAAWVTDDEVVRYDVVRYSQELDGQGRITYQHREDQTYSVDGSPWTTVSPAAFRRDGLVRRTPRGTHRYYMLSARLLLSDEFLNVHCFRAIGNKDETEVGLAFRPIERSASSDVEGVLWLDAADHALRAIEYEYHEPGSRARHAAARAQYRYIAGGLWLLADWHTTFALERETTTSRSDEAYVRDGWQVVRAIRADDGRTLWADSLGLQQVGRAQPPADDVIGIAQFSAAAMASEVCAPRRYSPDSRTDAVGLVLDAAGSPVFGAEVRVSTRSGWEARAVTTQQSGIYTVCGVPVGETVVIDVRHAGFQARSAMIQSRGGWLIVQSFELTARP